MSSKVSQLFQSEKDSTITGNVHSGATPPWMINDPDDDATNSTEGKVMGPTQEDFDKNCKAYFFRYYGQKQQKASISVSPL